MISDVKYSLYLKVDPYDSGSWKVLQNTTRMPVVKPGVLINNVFHWIGPLFVSEKKWFSSLMLKPNNQHLMDSRKQSLEIEEIMFLAELKGAIMLFFIRIEMSQDYRYGWEKTMTIMKGLKSVVSISVHAYLKGACLCDPRFQVWNFDPAYTWNRK